ncbi:MAG TPA: nucleoside/nucleotide kinase family protein [Pseudolysinimonas sp.]|nr:nucleoside/nucleotide kinase family protein [Pseudolysinimonas sp.]
MSALDTAAAFVERLPGDRRVLVGIAGAPGAGKSTFAAALAARLGAVVLPMDGFHLPQARLVELGRRERMGAPDTFDVEGFVALLRALRTGERVEAPGFDRDVEEPVPAAIAIEPGDRILIIEGNYLLHWPGVADLLDATIFVHLDDRVRRTRLVARHIASGKSPAGARAWVLGPDEANAELIAPGAARAGLVLELD